MMFIINTSHNLFKSVCNCQLNNKCDQIQRMIKETTTKENLRKIHVHKLINERIVHGSPAI